MTSGAGPPACIRPGLRQEKGGRLNVSLHCVSLDFSSAQGVPPSAVFWQHIYPRRTGYPKLPDLALPGQALGEQFVEMQAGSRRSHPSVFIFSQVKPGIHERSRLGVGSLVFLDIGCSCLLYSIWCLFLQVGN